MAKRILVYLFDHPIKVREGGETSGGSGGGSGNDGGEGGGAGVYENRAVLSRVKKSIKEALNLVEPTSQQLEGKTVESPNGEIWTAQRRGSLFDDRIILVRSAETSKGRKKTYRIPIPSWAPNYKLASFFAGKGDVIGMVRHGSFIKLASSDSGSGSQ